MDGLVWACAIETGGVDHGAHGGFVVRHLFGAEAVGDLARDDAGPQLALDAVVGGLDLARKGAEC